MKIAIVGQNALKAKSYDLWVAGAGQLAVVKQRGRPVKPSEGAGIDWTHVPAPIAQCTQAHAHLKSFSAKWGEEFNCFLNPTQAVTLVGLGEAAKIESEKLRRLVAQLATRWKGNHAIGRVAVDLGSLYLPTEQLVTSLAEALAFANYDFKKYRSAKPKAKKESTELTIDLVVPAKELKKSEQTLQSVLTIMSSMRVARDFVNEVPNVLNSERFAQWVVDDATKTLGSKRINIQVLNKRAIVREKMNLLLAVNQGSHYEPRIVHLHYRPKSITKQTPHVALVGKGLTYDSGGYSLKGGTSLVEMKCDMAGAATVYAAFRSAVLLQLPIEVSCYLGMTDNMISPQAITPDCVVWSRAGKSVEIANTDAEGRLVLADLLDYAQERSRPQIVIDAATLTGACANLLGEACGVMGNDQAVLDQFLQAARSCDERAWQLPLFEEYAEDMKSSQIADFKNIGNGKAGAQKAGAFLQFFIHEDVKWVHLDIAGLAYNVNIASYCAKKGASGLMIRSLVQFLRQMANGTV